jgi:hypothetical protein
VDGLVVLQLALFQYEVEMEASGPRRSYSRSSLSRKDEDRRLSRPLCVILLQSVGSGYPCVFVKACRYQGCGSESNFWWDLNSTKFGNSWECVGLFVRKITIFYSMARRSGKAIIGGSLLFESQFDGRAIIVSPGLESDVS